MEDNEYGGMFWIMLALGIIGVVGFIATVTAGGQP